MQYAFQAKLNTFDFFATRPKVFQDYDMFMGNTMGAQNYWVDWFPVEDRVVDGATADRALLVDVGGGKGHDLLALDAKFPGQGRLVLQDIPAVISVLNGLNPNVETMKYDFFTPQPLIGARVYFYHHILHDWSDAFCLDTLRQVKQAMTPGYSKSLLHEMIVPEQGATVFHSMLDMAMTAFNAGKERTERQWKELMTAAGLKVAKVWYPPQDGADGIIEVI